MALYTNPSRFAEAVLPAMATEPKELMEDWISTLEILKITPCSPAGSPMRTISKSWSLWMRSSLGSQKEALKDRLTCLTQALGGRTQYSGDYPAWEYKEDSLLRDRMVQVFREQYGREPKVEAIHAGVECGLLAGKIPGLDCVSIGPDLLEIHTPRERMSISSVQRVWAFLLEVLKRSK